MPWKAWLGRQVSGLLWSSGEDRVGLIGGSWHQGTFLLSCLSRPSGLLVKDPSPVLPTQLTVASVPLELSCRLQSGWSLGWHMNQQADSLVDKCTPVHLTSKTLLSDPTCSCKPRTELHSLEILPAHPGYPVALCRVCGSRTNVKNNSLCLVPRHWGAGV